MDGVRSVPAPCEVVRVRVTDRGFEPSQLRVTRGSQVAFTVYGSLSHILTGPGLPASPLLRPGDTFEVRFTSSGLLGDEVLSYIRGSVEVLDSAALASPHSATAEAVATPPESLAMATTSEDDRSTVDPPVTARGADLIDPGPRAGKWSGLSWDVVQERYRQLKVEFSGATVGDATGSDVDSGVDGRRQREPRVSRQRPMSGRHRTPATAPRTLTLSGTDDDDDDENDDGTDTKVKTAPLPLS